MKNDICCVYFYSTEKICIKEKPGKNIAPDSLELSNFLGKEEVSVWPVNKKFYGVDVSNIKIKLVREPENK